MRSIFKDVIKHVQLMTLKSNMERILIVIKIHIFILLETKMMLILIGQMNREPVFSLEVMII